MPKHYKSGVTVYDADDIAAAFGMAPPSTPCRACGHPRGEHRRQIDQPERAAKEGMFPGRKDTYEECEKTDRRRTTSNGVCPCVGFVEPRLGEEKK